MTVTRFCTLRARAKRDFFFMDRFLLPRRFQRGIARPWAGSRSGFRSGPRDPDRLNTHYENIYIDVFSCHIEIMHQFLFNNVKPKNLRMGKRLKMIEEMVTTDSVWSLKIPHIMRKIEKTLLL